MDHAVICRRTSTRNTYILDIAPLLNADGLPINEMAQSPERNNTCTQTLCTIWQSQPYLSHD